ncbi:MAG: site-2 protease family protein, partial [Planctomycetota bacterium]
MSQILPFAATAFDLALVVVGFGLIIVIHELGHFVAARWAGIRVFAFAVGFGPAVVSFRKGMGWRRGSSEADYRAQLSDRGLTVHDEAPSDISPTEYRLNWLPFGGYVKMLGQE